MCFGCCITDQDLLLRRPISPDVGRLVGELGGHEGEVLPHLDPEVGFGDAAVVCVDGVDTSHLPSDHSDRTHECSKAITKDNPCHQIKYKY